MVKRRVPLCEEIESKIRQDLWNAAAGCIMRYGPTKLGTIESLWESFQRFSTRRMYLVTIEGEAGEEDTGRQQQIDARKRENARRAQKGAPTIYSRICKVGLGDICRWETSTPPVYMDNKMGCESELRISIHQWGRTQSVLRKYGNTDQLADDEL